MLMHRLMRAAALLWVFVLLGANARAAPLEALDRWYVLEMGGQRSGWMHSTRRVEGERVISGSEMRLEVRRGELAIAVSLTSSFEETAAGEPVSMRTAMDLGTGKPTETVFTFAADGVRVSRGGVEGDVLPKPEGAWLPPGAASEYLARRIEAGATEVAVRTVDPASGLEPVTVTRRGFTETTVETLGRSVPALRCVSSTSNFPAAEAVEFIDRAGEVIRSETRIGAFSITMLLADRELALSPLDPPELMQSLFITPSRPIEGARASRVATYVLKVAEGEMAALPAEGVQRVERLAPGAMRVTIDLLGEASGLGAGEDAAALVRATPTLQCDDPEVKALAERGAGAETAPGRVAENLRRAVYGHMTKKALSVGFASAAETVRTREGDCTEHAVLLAAVLRARGIPSRVVSGVIYADQFAGSEDIFGYHMWTQALLPDAAGTPRWVDLDATLPGSTRFDATHIALSLSDLAGDSPVNGLVALAPLMGRLTIEVESVQ